MFILNKNKALCLFIGSLIGLSGCTHLEPSPVEQVQNAQKDEVTKQIEPVKTVKRAVEKKQSVTLYTCSKNKEVRILKNKTPKKNSVISVTYAGTTHRLSPVVTKNGKKYSNIRWVWWEPLKGKAILMDNRQKVLAEDCVKATL